MGDFQIDFHPLVPGFVAFNDADFGLGDAQNRAGKKTPQCDIGLAIGWRGLDADEAPPILSKKKAVLFCTGLNPELQDASGLAIVYGSEIRNPRLQFRPSDVIVRLKRLESPQ